MIIMIRITGRKSRITTGIKNRAAFSGAALGCIGEI
jgi:hypothetical protein